MNAEVGGGVVFWPARRTAGLKQWLALVGGSNFNLASSPALSPTPRRLALPAGSLVRKNSFLLTNSMSSRVALLGRHLLRRPSLYSVQTAAPRLRQSRAANTIMASGISLDERNSRTINTAACLIIGDEVLGGKASFASDLVSKLW